MQETYRPKLRVTASLAALWLAACGGGGDGGFSSVAPAAAGFPMAAAAQLSVAPSLVWTAAFATPQIWHSLSSNATGDVLVAGEAGGLIQVSSDAGASWTAGNSTSGTWISSAMSGTGDRIFAVQYGGGMFTSTDHGTTWSQVTSSPLVYNPAGIGFEAVTVSQDGQHIAAVIQNGLIVLSGNGGVTWSAGTLPDAPQNRWWRWIDSSSDGRVLVAVSHNGEIYRSSDAGASWKAVTVSVGVPAVAVAESWYRVKLSADGGTVAVAANTFGGSAGTGIYVSHDSGATWTQGYNLVADYTFLAMSADGQTIGATVSNTGATAGRVLLSTDGGASFAPLTTPGSDTNWRAMAMSANGQRMAVAAGGFNTQTPGLLYTARVATTPAPSPTPAPTPAPSPTPAPTPAPACSAPAWNGTTRYMPGDTVLRNGLMYAATPLSASVWNVNSPPEWTPSYWSMTSCTAPAPAPSPSPAPPPPPACTAASWSGTTRYIPGDRVLRNGSQYVATALSASVWNVNSPPEWTPTYWTLTSCT